MTARQTFDASSARSRRLEQAYRGTTVGLFGGSFNPAHEGHAHVAETALKRLGLQKIWWLVTPQNPLKDARETAPLAARMASARKFARGRAMVVSDIESRWGTRFSYDLIRKLRAHYPGVRFVWILGSDNLINFHRWRRWKDLVAALPVAFVARPGAMARGALQRYGAALRWRAAHERKGRSGFRQSAPSGLFCRARWNPRSSTALRPKK